MPLRLGALRPIVTGRCKTMLIARQGIQRHALYSRDILIVAPPSPSAIGCGFCCRMIHGCNRTRKTTSQYAGDHSRFPFSGSPPVAAPISFGRQRHHSSADFLLVPMRKPTDGRHFGAACTPGNVLSIVPAERSSR
jgi:hypothetical protein